MKCGELDVANGAGSLGLFLMWRSFARVKDSAMIDLTRGAIPRMGTTKIRLLRAIGYAAVNLKLVVSFTEWLADPSRRRRKPRRRKHFIEALDRIRAAPPAAAAHSPPAA